MVQLCGSHMLDPGHDFLAWYQTCLITWDQVEILGPRLAFVTISELHSDSASWVTLISTGLFGNADFWLTSAVLMGQPCMGTVGVSLAWLSPLHPWSLLQEWFLIPCTLFLPGNTKPCLLLCYLFSFCYVYFETWTDMTRTWHKNHRPYTATMLRSFFLP